MATRPKTIALKKADPTMGLPLLHQHAAGIDVGSAEHWVAVPPGCDPEPVRYFGSFTADLHRLAGWLAACGVKTVAMESTGIYWIALFQVLEARGFAVHLVDARRAKSLPGRKSDLLDCQWLQKLHTFGLLNRCFRPTEEVCVLRSYLRQRENLVAAATISIQHMQKALAEMNVQLTNVISDLSGTTGLAIIRAILQGERDPNRLAELRDCRIQAKSVHSGIGHSSNELRATAVSCSETGTTPINRIAEEDLPCPPALSSKSPQKNKPVYWQSCVGLAETSGSLFTSCFC